MQEKNYLYLQAHPELRVFVRYNPIWYRYLSRDTNRLDELEKEAKKFYGKTFTKRLEKVNNQVQMVGMLMHLAGAMKD